jgi:basic membrane protein A
METWYANGTEVVFSCGGGIFVSVSEAASKHGGKVIGVDTDQKNLIDGMYGEGITITSALKGLYPATYDALDDIINNGKWDDYRGKILSLGLISGTDPDANYLSLPINSTMWNDDFTEQDYRELVNNIYLRNIVISDDISHEPVTSNVNVEWLGSIK